MAQLDQFKADYEKAMDALKRIQTENQKRKNAQAAGQPTAKFDALLRGQLEQLNIQVQGLERVIIQGETSGLLLKEKEKRKTLVSELRSQYNFLKDGILADINAPKPTTTVRTTEGETEEVKAMSNKDLKNQSQAMLKSWRFPWQEEQFEELHGVIKGIHYGQKAIGQETDTHMKLLDQADVEIDKTTANIVVVDTKLKKLIKSSNTCCLWTVIIVELVAIGLLLWSLI